MKSVAIQERSSVKWLWLLQGWSSFDETCRDIAKTVKSRCMISSLFSFTNDLDIYIILNHWFHMKTGLIDTFSCITHLETCRPSVYHSYIDILVQTASMCPAVHTYRNQSTLTVTRMVTISNIEQVVTAKPSLVSHYYVWCHVFFTRNSRLSSRFVTCPCKHNNN